MASKEETKLCRVSDETYLKNTKSVSLSEDLLKKMFPGRPASYQAKVVFNAKTDEFLKNLLNKNKFSQKL